MKFTAGLDGKFEVEIDLEHILAERWDKILGIFGKDAFSTELKHWIEERTSESLVTAKDVKIVGMRDAIALPNIYQPTRLHFSGYSTNAPVPQVFEHAALSLFPAPSSSKLTSSMDQPKSRAPLPSSAGTGSRPS